MMKGCSQAMQMSSRDPYKSKFWPHMRAAPARKLDQREINREGALREEPINRYRVTNIESQGNKVEKGSASGVEEEQGNTEPSHKGFKNTLLVLLLKIPCSSTQ